MLVKGATDIFMRQLNKPALIEIMACRTFGTKSFFERKLAYCQSDKKEAKYNDSPLKQIIPSGSKCMIVRVAMETKQYKTDTNG